MIPCKYDRIGPDHRRIKFGVRSMLGFESEATPAIISVGIGQGRSAMLNNGVDSGCLDQQSSSVSRDQLESDNARQNQSKAKYPQRRSGVAEHRHSQNRGACRANAGPDRVGSPHWQCAER